MYRSPEFKRMEEIDRKQEVLYAQSQEKKGAKRSRDPSGPRVPSSSLTHTSSSSFPTRPTHRPSKKKVAARPSYSDLDSEPDPDFGSDPEWDPRMGD